MKSLKIIPLLCYILIAYFTVCRADYTPEEFAADVSEHNEQMKGLVMSWKAQQLKAQEADLLTSLELFSQGLYQVDRRETINPNFMGAETFVRGYEIGVRNQNTLGQELSLKYTSRLVDLQGTILPNATAYEVGSVLELRQSLWKNGFGKQLRARQRTIRAQYGQWEQSLLFRIKEVIMSAELAYWSYSLTLQNVELQRQSLARVKQIVAWTEQRRRNQLGDTSDYLQAKARATAKELDVMQAELDARNWSLKFYQLLGHQAADAEKKQRKLVVPATEKLLNLKLPVMSQEREDLMAQGLEVQALEEAAFVKYQDFLPDIKLMGSLGYWGRDLDESISRDESFDGHRPYWSVGVSLTVPLDFSGTKKVTQGSYLDAYGAKARHGAMAQFQREEKEQFLDNLYRSQDMLKKALEYENSESEKLAYEKKRLRQGRSTTYQVLVFELDYLNATLATLRAKSEVLKALASLKLYSPLDTSKWDQKLSALK